MNALKNLLSPLSANTSPIHDTLVSPGPHIQSRPHGVTPGFAEISCYRRDCGDRPKGLGVCMEWVC